MTTVRFLRPASLAIVAALAVPGAAGATVTVGAQGAWVDGPEAPAPAKKHAAADRSGETPVLAQDKRETNLRKSPEFVSVLGIATLR